MSDAPDQNDPEVRAGDVLAGKYRVEEVLGRGGMGVVVAATHTVLQNKVALKFLLPSVAKNPNTTTRFLREAQAAVKIKSPHVARVLDVGQMEDSGSPYMVMEYLEGQDLGAILEREGAIDIGRACLYALETCEALAAAHAAGIVHRDIKPANLFITPGPDGAHVVKVLDFGISKNVVDAGLSNLTQTQTSMGSPLYMSPEQMRSARDVDARTDIWSLGVVLFEAVTGNVPFIADTMPQLVALVLEEVAPLANTVRGEVPEELAQVIARCLEKDRNKRYQHIGQLAMALAPFAPKGGLVSAERTSRIISTSGLAGTVEVEAVPTPEGSDIDLGVIAPPPNLRGTATSFGRTGEGAARASRKPSLGVFIGAGGALFGLAAILLLVLSKEDPEAAGGSGAATVNAADEAPTGPEAPQQEAAQAEAAQAEAVQREGSSEADEARAALPSASSAGAAASVPSTPLTTDTGSAQVPAESDGKPRGTPHKKPKKSDPFGDRF